LILERYPRSVDLADAQELKMTDRIAVFIDGTNNHLCARALGFEIDFKRLLSEFALRGSLLRAFYYTTTHDQEEFSGIRPLIDWLSYNGFAVRTKPAKVFDNEDGRRTLKRSMAIELAIDAMDIARYTDRIFLFSGDGDLKCLVEALQRLGTRVIVVSSMRTKPPMIADELRRQADEFIELDVLKTSIARPDSNRA
jgi:uncharacterized LabA/DUF88 family protein